MIRLIVDLSKCRLSLLLLSCFFNMVIMTMAAADNLDLSTVPKRKSVQLTIYNSKDLTLVRETRLISFKQGDNPLQFSWANTLIDPTSVALGFRGQDDVLTLFDTTYPYEKPRMLYWQVKASVDIEAEVEISYFTAGISWVADYVAIANPQETALQLDGFVTVSNRSGESYEQAQVRLVVGEINLVEQIAELARVATEEVEQLEAKRLEKYRRQLTRKAMAAPTPMASEMMLAEREMALPVQAKTVAKEGLGEYFIYTISGKETLVNGWAKRLRSFSAETVPVNIVYRYRQQAYGDQLVRFYLLQNTTEVGLGTTPIPNGQVRVLREGGEHNLCYLAAQKMKYVAVGDRIELNLGVDPMVVFTLVKDRLFRDEIWVRMNKGRVYRRVGSGQLQVDHQAKVAGWDEHQLFRQRIRNYTGRPIRLEIRRTYPGDVIFRSRLGVANYDYNTVEIKAQVGIGGGLDLPYELIHHHGYNKKQDRVAVVRY